MQMVRLALKNGWVCAALNNRGTNGTPLRTFRAYCGAYTEDIRMVVGRIRKRFGEEVFLAGIGFSLGANMMTKYVGEQSIREKEAASSSSSSSSSSSIALPSNEEEEEEEEYMQQDLN